MHCYTTSIFHEYVQGQIYLLPCQRVMMKMCNGWPP